MKTIVRFFESEDEKAIFAMGDTQCNIPSIPDPPAYLPKKYEAVYLPGYDTPFIVTDVTHSYDDNFTFVDIMIIPEDNY